MRSIHIFYLHTSIGPKIQIILRMIWDLIYFFVLFAVFLLAYGVASQALLYPATEQNNQKFIKIIYNPYYVIYEQFDAIQKQFSGNECAKHNDTLDVNDIRPKCSALAVVLFAVYAAISCLLLVNLLIAIFNTTFQNIPGMCPENLVISSP